MVDSVSLTNFMQSRAWKKSCRKYSPSFSGCETANSWWNGSEFCEFNRLNGLYLTKLFDELGKVDQLERWYLVQLSCKPPERAASRYRSSVPQSLTNYSLGKANMQWILPVQSGWWTREAGVRFEGKSHVEFPVQPSPKQNPLSFLRHKSLAFEVYRWYGKYRWVK